MNLLQILVLVLLLLKLLVVKYSCQKKTVLRTNWGVHFDEIGSVINGNQISYYLHSFAIPLPKPVYEISERINCTDHMDWYVLCKSLNKVITDTNRYNYEVFSTSMHTIQQTISLIPKRNISEGDKRFKRNIWHKIGNAFTDLFHMPSPKDFELLKNHLHELNNALRQNTDAVKLFNDDLSSTQILFNDRLSNIRTGLKKVEDLISQTIDNLNNTFKTFQSDLTTLQKRISSITGVMRYITNHFQSLMFQKQLMMKQLLAESQNWYQGIIELYDGKLPNYIIPSKCIVEIIQHIRRNILTQPRYSHVKLLSENPYFYSKQKDLMFTLHGEILVILVKFPLKDIEGLLKIYRAYTFPVPLTSGMMQMKEITSDDSYTIIENIPEYIAVSSNGEYYLTMTTAIYESCEGEEIKICKSGMPSIKRSTTVTCISALFFDDTSHIQKICNPLWVKSTPQGSAIQLEGHNSFLIHSGSGGRDTWRLRCVNNNMYTQQSLNPCKMCQIKLPCFCTLGTDQFEVSAQMTKCNKSLSKVGLPAITYLYHPNLAMITSFFPDDIMAQLKGFQYKTNNMYPSLHSSLPNITHSNWSNIIRKDSLLKSNLVKLTTMMNNRITAYQTKEDFIDKKLKDFSDVTIRKSANLLKVVKDVFGIFGSVGRVLGTIFSEFGLSVIALFFSSIMCVPLAFWHINKCCRRKGAKYNQRKTQHYTYNVKYHRLKNNNTEH